MLVNAVTGESQYYEEVPTWVDRVYSSDIIMEQYDYYGQFHNGFLNSILRPAGRDADHRRAGTISPSTTMCICTPA